MKKYLLFYFLLFSMQTYFSQEARFINTELLNVRSGPGKNYEVLETAPKGEKVTVLSANGNWTQVQMDSGIKGFVSSKFLITDIPSPEKTNSESGTWWKTILGIIGFLFLVKLFGGKTSSSTSAGGSSKPSSSLSTRKVSSYDLAKLDTSIISTNKSNSVTEKLSPTKNKKYFCKYCGMNYQSITSLTSNRCSNSPSSNHELFEGDEMEKYFCKCCGSNYSSIRSLTFNRCNNSPSGNHQPYEGQERNKYFCKYCGRNYPTIKSLCFNRCNKSPTGNHQPAL